LRSFRANIGDATLAKRCTEFCDAGVKGCRWIIIAGKSAPLHCALSPA
jgi:hypothetical protein